MPSLLLYSLCEFYFDVKFLQESTCQLLNTTITQALENIFDFLLPKETFWKNSHL